MDLTIIVVSYNTRELLADCLQATLTGLERSQLEGVVWVVDNASADGSPALVRERFPGVRLAALDRNLGFAAGNNLALARMGFPETCRPRHVLFLNPDTRVLGDALGAMVRFMDGAPPAGAAGARLVHGDGSFQHSAFAFPGLSQIAFDLIPVHGRLIESRVNGRYPRRLYEAGRPFAVDHPLGAALMVRGEALAQVGAFDERYFMYCEEIDLCRRIKAAGWQIYCVPQAEIVHLVGQSTGQFREAMFVALWRSRFRMYRQHNSPAFLSAARRLVRLGLGIQVRRTETAHRQGRIDTAERDRRLKAFAEVATL